MSGGVISLEYLLFFLEIIVLLFLIWHIRELAINSNELKKVVKEMHDNHKEMHADTKVIKDSVDRLESDIAKLKPKPKKKRIVKKK